VTSLVQIIVSVLGGGGVVGGIFALIKFKPESGAIVVTAAQGALVVQSSVIDSLQKENARQRTRIDDLQVENNELRVRVGTLERELHSLRDEITGRDATGSTNGAAR
jgi:hypothetical protein